jgi:hypothetical protein
MNSYVDTTTRSEKKPAAEPPCSRAANPRTPDQQKLRDEATAHVMAYLRTIGESYGRMIARSSIVFGVPPHERLLGIDAALADTRAYLVTNGASEHDIEICLHVMHRSILLTVLSNKTETVQ